MLPDVGFVTEFNYIMLAVAIPLVFFGLFMPCIMVCLDRHDYENVENDVYKVDEKVIEHMVNNKKLKYKCRQAVYYKLKEIERY